METPKNSSNKTSKKIWDISKFTPFLFGALFLKSPSLANAQNTLNLNKTQVEISTTTILDRLDKEIGISLPDEFNGKVLDFVLNDTIMKTKSATEYTENFIINEMKKDRGISKENQLLFIRSTIYEGITQNFLYDRFNDKDKTRSNEYGNALTLINESYEEYEKGFKVYMEKKSAEYKQQSAEARQQSAEAIKEIMEQDSIRLKKSMIEFYEISIRSQNTVKKEDIDFAKESTKTIIGDCKKYGIDYRAILLKEVGDMKKVDAILKFYEIE